MKLATLALALTLTMAGCIGGSDDDGAPTVFTSDEPDLNQTLNNTLPVAMLSVDVLNGTAPLLVNFTLEATDADGDNLTWEFDPTGNGTVEASGMDLPFSLNWTYMAGNFTPTLMVSDANGTVTATGSITVDAGAVEVPEGPSVTPLFEVFEMVEGCELCVDGAPAFNGADGCVGWLTQEEGVDCAWLAFGEEYEGTPFSIYSFTSGTLAPFGSDGDVDIEFRTGCGLGSDQLSTQWQRNGDVEAGIIPEGTRCIVAYEFHWPNVGHTIEFSIGADVHSE